MAFRKRNAPVSSAIQAAGSAQDRLRDQEASQIPTGIRPSPLDGRPTISTGSHSLDKLLGGHAALPTGCSLLIEENGTTDFAGALLRFYAAQGILHDQHVHIVGLPETWARELPGLLPVTERAKLAVEPVQAPGNERMKIAWRYERLGDFGASDQIRRDRAGQKSGIQASQDSCVEFCNSFDLTKRLDIKDKSRMHFIPTSPENVQTSPFVSIIDALRTSISSLKDQCHRILIPALLSPALYPHHASDPTLLLPFLRNLRALLREHHDRVTAFITLPISLFPRTTSLVCWTEQLSDGVIELTPFPRHFDMDTIPSAQPTSKSSSKPQVEEKPQGLVKVHKIPILTERGAGCGTADDMAFLLSRKSFQIMPFHLPPVEGDHDAQQAAASNAKDIAF